MKKSNFGYFEIFQEDISNAFRSCFSSKKKTEIGILEDF